MMEVMIFEREMLKFDILDVIKINQKNVNLFNTGRNYSALSFRVRASTTLKTEEKEIFVGDNSVCFVPAGADYRRISDYDEMIVVHFDALDYKGDKIEYFLPSNPKRLLNLFEEILDCHSKNVVGCKYRCGALFYQILGECFCQNFKSERKNSKIQKSVEYIDENYRNKDLSIREIAEKSFVSEVWFRRLFKEEYGISPKKYIINLRIKSAEKLISTGYYSLKEVADAVGYNDYKHFSTEFKKVTGISPSYYLDAKNF